jgi:hypothetical protein
MKRHTSISKCYLGQFEPVRLTRLPSAEVGEGQGVGGRAVNVEVDELEKGKVVQLDDRFSSFGTAPLIRLPAGL